MTQTHSAQNHPDPRPRRARRNSCALLARGLPRDEFDVHVVCPDPRRAAGGRIGRGGPAAGGDRQAMEARSAGVLAAEGARGPNCQPELIHTWMFAANAYGFAAAKNLRGKASRDRPNGALIRGKAACNWPSTGPHLARRSSRVVVTARACGIFNVRHGTPAQQVRVIPTGWPCPEKTRPPRGVNCWPNWNCPPTPGWSDWSGVSGRRNG